VFHTEFPQSVLREIAIIKKSWQSDELKCDETKNINLPHYKKLRLNQL